MAAGGEQAGSAYVPIRPDLRGFHREIETQLRSILGPILERIGRQASEEFGRGFERQQQRQNPFEPFEEQQQRQRRRQRPEGQATAGAFAQSFERALRRASEQLPRIEVNADSSEADRALAELRGRMERLAAAKVGVDVSVEDATRELAEIRAALEAAGEGADVQIRMDLGAALGQLNRFQEQIDRLDHDDVEVQVDADTDSAEEGLERTSLLTRILSAHLRGLSAAGRGGMAGVTAGLRGLRTGTQVGTQGVLKLGAASAGVFGAMGAGVAGLALGIAALGVKIALANDEIKKVFTDTFADIQKQAAELAKPFLGPLRQIAGIIKTTFATIAPQLGAAFEAIAPALVPLAQGISELVRRMAALFEPIAKVGAQILSSLGPALGTLGQQLVQFLSPILQALSQVGAGLFTTLIGGIGQLLVTLGPLIATMVQVGSTLLGPLLTAVNQIVGALAAALMPVLRAIAPVFVQLVGALAPLISQLVTGLSPILVALAPILGNVFSILQPVISALISGLQPVIAALVPVVGLLVGALGQIIAAIVPLLVPLGRLIASLVSGLLPVLTPIITLIAQTAATILGALVQALIQCMPALQSIVLAIAQLLPLLTPLIPLWSQLLLAVIPLIPVLVQLVAMLVGYLVPVLRVLIGLYVRVYSTVLGLLIPVLRLLVSVITWVAGLIQPILTAIGVGLRWLGTAAMWLWTNAIGPAFRAIATLASWLYQIVAVVVIGALIISFKLLSAVVMWLWRTVFVNAWKGIGAVVRWAYNTFIRPIVNTFVSVLRTYLAPALQWFWNSVVRPVWTAVGNGIRRVWNTWIKPTFDNVRSGVSVLAGYFRNAVSAISKAWSGLRSAARKPVQYVVDVVYNKGIVKIWNAVADLVPGVNPLSPVKFARGGIMPGYAPGRDKLLAAVSPGESIFRPEFTRAVGEKFVTGANAAARSGGTAGVMRFLGLAGDPGMGPGFAGHFALGGIVGGFLKSAKNWFAGGLVKTATAAFNPLISTAQRAIGGTAFGDLAVGAARGLVGRILGFFKPLESKLGANSVVRAARSQLGVPYVWGGTNWNVGLDCSGLTSGAWKRGAGVWIGRTTYNQYPASSHIDAPRPAALGFPHMGHVVMASKPGHIIEAPYTGANVREVPISRHYEWRWPHAARGAKFDSGGWLMPGLQTVANYTRKPEAVLTDRQYAAMSAAARIGTTAGNTYVVYPREHTLTEAGLERMTRRQDALARIDRPA